MEIVLLATFVAKFCTAREVQLTVFVDGCTVYMFDIIHTLWTIYIKKPSFLINIL